MELLKGLLGVDINGGEPAAETRMGVVPAHNDLLSRERGLLAELQGGIEQSSQQLELTGLFVAESLAFWSGRRGPRLQH